MDLIHHLFTKHHDSHLSLFRRQGARCFPCAKQKRGWTKQKLDFTASGSRNCLSSHSRRHNLTLVMCRCPIRAENECRGCVFGPSKLMFGAPRRFRTLSRVRKAAVKPHPHPHLINAYHPHGRFSSRFRTYIFMESLKRTRGALDNIKIPTLVLTLFRTSWLMSKISISKCSRE